jgi:(S)-ureidoglycine aminohydrolase
VWAPLPGWRGAAAAIHIAPVMGARFTQATVALENGGAAGPPAVGVQRFVYPLEGRLQLKLAGGGAKSLAPGDFAYLPAGVPHELTAVAASRIVMFEKTYVLLAGVEKPAPIVGRVADAEGAPFMDDPAARLQTLLPTDERFDMAVNVFTYQPGAALPQVEIHVMEHGLVMLDGAGVYRLGDSWYPVEAGDVIWMRSYCPQWFVAMGKEPARYLYFKDMNRDPLA